MILSILVFFSPKNFFLDLSEKYQNLYTFYVFQKMNLLPQFFYAMVFIWPLSMVGDGGGRRGVGRALAERWEGVDRALAGRWQGVGRALAGRWRGVGGALAGGEGWGLESDL